MPLLLNIAGFSVFFNIVIPSILLAFVWIYRGSISVYSYLSSFFLPASERANASGMNAQQDGQLQLAVDEFSRAIQLEPETAQYWANRGMCQDALGNSDAAIVDMTHAIELSPSEPEFYHQRGVLRLHRREYQLSLQDQSEAIRLDSENGMYHRYRGDAHFECDAYENAIADYTRAIRLDVGDVMAYQGRINALIRLERHEQSIRECTRVLRKFPANFVIVMLRAITKYHQGDLNAAMEDINTAIHLSPANPTLLDWRGKIHTSLGNYADAIKDFDEAVQKSPDDLNFLIDRANTKYKQGDFESALKDFKLATTVAPNSANAYNSLAVVLVQLERMKEALAAAERSYQIDPKKGLGTRGYVRVAAGQYDSGFRDMKDALKLNPGNALQTNQIAWFRAVLEAPEARNSREALEYAEKACQMTEYREWGFIDTKAAALADAGRWHEAIEVQRRVVNAVGHKSSEYSLRLNLYLNHQPYRKPFKDL